MTIKKIGKDGFGLCFLAALAAVALLILVMVVNRAQASVDDFKQECTARNGVVLVLSGSKRVCIDKAAVISSASILGGGEK